MDRRSSAGLGWTLGLHLIVLCAEVRFAHASRAPECCSDVASQSRRRDAALAPGARLDGARSITPLGLRWLALRGGGRDEGSDNTDSEPHGRAGVRHEVNAGRETAQAATAPRRTWQPETFAYIEDPVGPGQTEGTGRRVLSGAYDGSRRDDAAASAAYQGPRGGRCYDPWTSGMGLDEEEIARRERRERLMRQGYERSTDGREPWGRYPSSRPPLPRARDAAIREVDGYASDRRLWHDDRPAASRGDGWRRGGRRSREDLWRDSRQDASRYPSHGGWREGDRGGESGRDGARGSGQHPLVQEAYAREGQYTRKREREQEPPSPWARAEWNRGAWVPGGGRETRGSRGNELRERQRERDREREIESERERTTNGRSRGVGMGEGEQVRAAGKRVYADTEVLRDREHMVPNVRSEEERHGETDRGKGERDRGKGERDRGSMAMAAVGPGIGWASDGPGGGGGGWGRMDERRNDRVPEQGAGVAKTPGRVTPKTAMEEGKSGGEEGRRGGVETGRQSEGKQGGGSGVGVAAWDWGGGGGGQDARVG
jgi:hypothetical protein